MQISQARERKAGSDIEQNRVRLRRAASSIGAAPGSQRHGEISRLAAADDIEIVLAEHVFKTNQQHGLVA
jgi:hypothetical protein